MCVNSIFGNKNMIILSLGPSEYFSKKKDPTHSNRQQYDKFWRTNQRSDGFLVAPLKSASPRLFLNLSCQLIIFVVNNISLRCTK